MSQSWREKVVKISNAHVPVIPETPPGDPRAIDRTCGRDLEQRMLTGWDKKHGWELPAKDTSLQRAPSFQPNTSLHSDFGDSPGWECGEWVSEHPPGKEVCDI